MHFLPVLEEIREELPPFGGPQHTVVVITPNDRCLVGQPRPFSQGGDTCRGRLFFDLVQAVAHRIEFLLKGIDILAARLSGFRRGGVRMRHWVLIAEQ